MTRHGAFIGHARQRHDFIGCTEVWEHGWCLASFEHIYA